MKRLLILATLLILTACTAATESPTPTALPSPTATTTVTPSPTVTPSITPSPTATASPLLTPTEIQPTPDFLTLPIADNLLDSTDYDPDCTLPCWQGLRVGESDREDVQRMFDEALGFHGTLDVFKDYPIGEAELSLYKLDVQGTQLAGYGWHDLPNGGGISIFILVDDATGIMEGLQLSYASIGDFNTPTAQEIIEQLGKPTYMYVELRAGSGHNAPLERIQSSFVLIYDQGVAFSSSYTADTTIQTVDNNQQSWFDFCLNKAPLGFQSLVVVSPFSELWSEELTPIQKKWIIDFTGLIATTPAFKPAEEVLGLSLDEITRIALEEDPPCFDVDVTHLFE